MASPRSFYAAPTFIDQEPSLERAEFYTPSDGSSEAVDIGPFPEIDGRFVARVGVVDFSGACLSD